MDNEECEVYVAAIEQTETAKNGNTYVGIVLFSEPVYMQLSEVEHIIDVNVIPVVARMGG